MGYVSFREGKCLKSGADGLFGENGMTKSFSHKKLDTWTIIDTWKDRDHGYF